MRKRSAQKDLEVHQTVNVVVEIVFGAESSSFHDKDTGIQILRNQVQQKSKSNTIEEIVETDVADKKDTIEDAIVTMEVENEDY
ncbi:hypothetical protein Tco_0960268 [Tanacetum coccineum]